jgi:hypothetical protein
VEWAALSGEDVEAVVSNLLYNEHPRAVRIRPSQGDFGIDVLVPSQKAPGSWDVYQIKKFATTLDESHKRQIEKSFRRMLVALARQGVQVEDWYLVMPLDPTLENRLDWFQSMPAKAISAVSSDRELALTTDEQHKISQWHGAPGRIIDWKGLDFCQAMTSKYWYVPDYYLHGGSERIRAAVAEVAKILHRDVTLPASRDERATSLLQPSDIVGHLRRLQHALDGDPHFRYGVSLDPAPPEILDEPGLVAAAQEIDPDGACVTFRIYARFEEAVNERPIPVTVNFTVVDPGFDHDAFDMWLKYGTALSAPAVIDTGLPGGLGDGGVDGLVHITPFEGGRQSQVRLRVRRPDGTARRPVAFALASTTGLDGTGTHAQGSDESGLVRVEGLIDAQDMSGTFSFSMGELSGAEAAAVLPAAEFLADLVHPGTLQIAGRYGPFHDVFQFPETEPLIEPWLLRYIRALATIQDRVAAPLLVPDLGTVQITDVHSAARAAALIGGGTVVGNWAELTFEADTAAPIDPEAEYELLTTEPLTLALGAHTIVLGAMRSRLLSAKLTPGEAGKVQALPCSNNTAHSVLVADPADQAGPRTRVFARAMPRTAAEDSECTLRRTSQN